MLTTCKQKLGVPRDFKSSQGAKVGTLYLVYCVVQVCYGTAVEHKSLLNRPGVCDGFDGCNLCCSYIKTAFNFLFRIMQLVQSSVNILAMKRGVLEMEDVPSLFFEYLLTLIVEEPMTNCVYNYIRQTLIHSRYLFQTTV